MLKKFTKAALASMCLAFSAQAEIDNATYKSIPKDYNIVMGMDMKGLMTIPGVKDLMDASSKMGGNETPLMKPEDTDSAIMAMKLTISQNPQEMMTSLISSMLGFMKMNKGVSNELYIQEFNKNIEAAKGMVSQPGVDLSKMKIAPFKMRDLNCLKMTTPALPMQPPMDFVIFNNDKRIVMGSEKSFGLALDTAMAPGKSLNANADVAGLLKAENNSNLFLALVIDEKIKAEVLKNAGQNPMAPMIKQLNAAVLSVNYLAETKGLGISLKLNCTDAQSANGILGLFNMFILPSLNNPQSPVKQKDVKTGVEGSVMKVDVNINQQTLAQFTDLMKMGIAMQQPAAVQSADEEEAPAQQ